MKQLLTLLAIVFLGSTSFAQQDFILFHTPVIPQITQVDPASIPDSKIDIGLPIISSVYGSIFNTGFAFSDLFIRENGLMYFDVDAAKTTLDDNNFLVLNVNTDLLFLGFKVNENYYSFNVTEKVDFTFNYPKDLMLMAFEGNGRTFLGNRASFDGLGMDFTHWREYAFHWAHDVHHKFSYGVRLKYLYGMENFTTQVSNMGLTTNENTHDLTFDANTEFLTAGLPQIVTDNGPIIGGIREEQTNDAIADYAFGRGNHGFGVDLGFNYHVNDKLLLEASVLDLGFINWSQYTSSSTISDWDYTYSGINDPFTLLSDPGSGIEQIKQQMEDSVNASFKEHFTYSNPEYSTSLRTKIYASVEYVVDHGNYVSLTSYTSFVRDRWRQGLGLAYNYHFKKWLSATASYSMYNRSYSNVGLGVTFNLGPVELYALSDNVLAFFMPEDVRNAQAHFGLNLTFGRTEDKDKDGIPDHKDKCPELAGEKKFDGCPDTDKDGIPDDQDECPQLYGLPEFKGCPDTDGDGIGDLEDECIELAGSIEWNGCPDTDGDSIPDSQDDCPLKAGSKEFNGCPDTDKDGIIDSKDECPEIPGIAMNFGCPLNELTALSPDGMKLMTVQMNDEGVFVFEKLDPDKHYLFQLNGEDVYFSDELLIVFMDNGEKKLITAGKASDSKFDYQYLPQEKSTMALMVMDDDGNLIRTAFPDENGNFVFENLDPDKHYTFKLDGQDANFEELNIVFKNDKESKVLNVTKNQFKDFEFDFLPSDNPNMRTINVTDDGIMVLLEEEQEEVINKAFENLEFNYGSAVINHNSIRHLDELSILLEHHAAWKIVLSGHTDNVGSDVQNMALSKRRAESVKKHLVKQGVTATQIIVKYYGESKPITDNDTNEGREHNRRVEMSIVE